MSSSNQSTAPSLVPASATAAQGAVVLTFPTDAKALCPPLPIEDFVARTQADRDEVIEHVGGAGDILEIYGDEGSGKTRVALSIADAFLRGAKTWGPFHILKPGHVLLVENDLSPGSIGRICKQCLDAGALRGGQYRFFLANDRTPLRYAVHPNKIDVVHPIPVPERTTLVILDVWSTLFDVIGGGTPYDEVIIRRVIDRLRHDFPEALLCTINHTTGSASDGTLRSLSPGLRRAAETRYRVEAAPTLRDDGTWAEAGMMKGIGKFARQAGLPKIIPLRWDEDAPLPVPEGSKLSVGWWVRAFPEIDGLADVTTFKSARQALQALADVSGHSFEALRTEHRRKPNAVITAISEGGLKGGDHVE